ncbi:MAG: transcription termination/antitermination protein NusA [Clostridia bacterium]|nr:transcription termination/antitermination protein NusA [Clostridia bacterium]
MEKEFFDAVDALCVEKNISSDAMYEKIANAFVIAAGHNYGTKDGIFCTIEPAAHSIRLYMQKTVVPTDEDVMDPAIEISVDEAQKYRSGAIVDDIVEIDLEINDFGRIAAQTVKHVLRQGIREIEHSQVLEAFQSKNQEIVTATVRGIDAKTGNLTLEIGKAEAILPKNEQIPGESFEIGQLIKVYIVDVKNTEKGPKAMISRTHPGLVKRLFEQEVPEIFEGTIEVKGVSREAGSRTKLAVFSKDADIDPVGSCIGQRGARVNKIVSVLGGEKIDIVKYSENPAEFIAASLAPAEILSVEIISDIAKSCQVTVPDTQLSLAIGNKGQNARLAAKLTGWKIDIKPESGFYQPMIQL